MQVLFSRTAQARASCRCISCGQTAKTVARPKRRIGAGDIFTACYSTMLASAAIADAEVKSKRRREWDRAIEEARAEEPKHGVGAGEHGRGQEAEQTTYSKISDQRSSTFEDGASSVLNGQAVFGRRNRPPLNTPFQGKLRSLNLRIKESLTPTEIATETVGTVLLGDLDGSAEEWADEHHIAGIPFREPKRRLHLDKREDSIARLVIQLLGKISIFSDPDAYQMKDLSNETKAVLEAIDRLQTGFSKFPNYSWGNQQSINDTRSALHTSLYKICQNATPKRIEVDSIIAKICYNLLVSTVPPSIITYNIMIGELSRLKLHDVAEVVIDSYFCDTRYSPAMETTRLMLDHYVAKNDHEGFQAMLDRMRCTAPVTREPGKRIGNMRIGARAIKLLYHPEIQQWAVQQRVIHRNGELWRKAPRDSGVLNSIICGCLEMRAVRKAVRYLKAALRERQDIRDEWICAVATACVEKLDHKGALSLLNTILCSWRNEEGNPLFHFSRAVRYGIFQLMGLCGITMTKTPLTLRPFHYICSESLHDLLLHLQIESIKEKLQESAKWILQLRSASAFDSHFGSDTNPSRKDLGLLKHTSSYIRKDHVDLKRSQSRIYRSQLSFVKNKLERSAERLLQNQEQLLFLSYAALSEASQQQYNAQIHEPCSTTSLWDVGMKLKLLLQLTREERRPMFERNSPRDKHRVPEMASIGIFGVSACDNSLGIEHWDMYRKRELAVEA